MYIRAKTYRQMITKHMRRNKTLVFLMILSRLVLMAKVFLAILASFKANLSSETVV